MKKSLIKFITILSLSSTVLGADTFSLEVTKQRDVLRDNNVSLYVQVKPKDVNGSYSYIWREGNRTLGNTNPVKISFSKGKHNVSVEVISKQGGKKRVSMLVQSWNYKTVTKTSVYLENYFHTRVENKVYDYRNLLLYEKDFLEDNKTKSWYYTYDKEGNKKSEEYFLDNNKTAKVYVHLKPFNVIENKYDKEGRVAFKRIEEVIKDENSSKSRQTIMLYSYDKNSNIVKEEKLSYLGTYPVTLNAQHKIIVRERAKDYDTAHRHSHLITYRKYDERGNKIKEREESLRGKNIIPMVIHGANKIEYIYNENNDLVKEKAPNKCTLIKERIYSYVYSNKWK